MLQYFLDLFNENKDQCYNILLTILIEIKVNVAILY